MNDKSLKKNDQRKKNPLVFKLLAIAIPFFILFGFEGVLRIVNYGENYDLFIPNPMKGFEDYYFVNPNVGAKYFHKLEYTSPANDIFLKEKSENTVRVFVMGSSTVYGFPYNRNVMFSRILNKRLEEIYPGKNVEVINTSITAINSFTLRDFTKQIIRHQPDAVLIYAGHNEFYGAFGIGSNETMGKNRLLTRLHLTFMNLKSYQLIRNGVSVIGKKIAASKEDKVHGTLMKRIVGNKDILYKSEDYKAAMVSYEKNMDAIVNAFTKEQIPVFLSEVVSNVKDLKPFNSMESDIQESAIDVYTQAQIAEENEDYELALKFYNKARDLDGIRFRASSEVNEILHKLAILHNTHIIPMQKYFEDISPNRLIGNNLMTEHVHPNIEGQFIMAEAFFRELVRSKALGMPGNSKATSLSYFKNHWGYSAIDSLVAFHRIELMKNFWPFTTTESEINYKLSYKPQGYLDSVAFSVIKYSDITSEVVRLDLAKEYEKNGLYQQALKEYLALQCASPNIPINNRDVAKIYLKLSDLPSAILYFSKATKHSAHYFDFFKLGELLLIKGDYKQATEKFRQAYELAPNDKKLNILLKTYVGLVYNGETEQAQKVQTEIKKIKPDMSFDVPKKRYLYNKYIPSQTKSYIIAAQNTLTKGNQKEAIDILKRSLFVYNSHTASRFLGEIYFDLRDYKTAYYYFSKVYEDFKFDVRFLNNYTILLAAGNQTERALDCISQIEKIEPNYEGLSKLNSYVENVTKEQIKSE